MSQPNKIIKNETLPIPLISILTHLHYTMNTKVLQGLFDITSDNKTIHKIISASGFADINEQPFIRMLHLLCVENFAAISSKLRNCNLERCDEYAKKLMGDTPSMFWSANPDAVYDGIMSVLGDANDSNNGNREDALMIFRLLTWMISSDNHKRLSNLFYNPEFYKRLESLKQYSIDSMSCYEYLDTILQSDEKRYTKLIESKKSDQNDFLHQFVNNIIDGSEWKSIILPSVKINGFRAALLDCIVKRSLTEKNDHLLATMYAILLIFYSDEEISVAYELHNHWFNSTVMTNYITGEETRTCMMIDLVKDWCFGTGGKYLLQTVVYKIGAMNRDSCSMNNNILDAIVSFCNYHIEH